MNEEQAWLPIPCLYDSVRLPPVWTRAKLLPEGKLFRQGFLRVHGQQIKKAEDLAALLQSQDEARLKFGIWLHNRLTLIPRHYNDESSTSRRRGQVA